MKKITSILLLLFILSIYASAETLDVDFNKGILHLEGETKTPQRSVAVYILQIGADWREMEKMEDSGGLFVYNNEIKSDEKCKYSLDIELGEELAEGSYSIKIGSADFEKAKEIPFYYLSNTAYTDIINTLNGFDSEDKEGFKVYFGDNAHKIGFENSYELENGDAVVDMLFAYAKQTGFEAQDARKNARLYKTAALAEAIKEGKLTSLDEVIDEIYLEDSYIADIYNSYAETEEKTSYYISCIDTDSKTINEVEMALKNAGILTVVKYPNGSENIEKLFEKYTGYLGANTKDATSSCYKYIAGREYSDIESCVEDFNNKVKSINKKPNSSGGGGSGSFGGGGTISSGGAVGSYIPVAVETTKKPEEIEIKFIDLNSVPWGYKAISTLYSKGIINGKSETEFCPNDKITREEFVKLLVSLAGIEGSDGVNVFSDVPEDAWYRKYVVAAYEKGISRGIDDGVFGSGRYITREDMCLMAYNTMKVMGHECKEAELTFDDADEFYENSKPAVGSLESMKIVSGVGENKFSPKGNATRAQAAVIIYNILNYVGE